MAGLIFLWQQQDAAPPVEPTPPPTYSGGAGGGVFHAAQIQNVWRSAYLEGSHTGYNLSTGALSASASLNGSAIGRTISKPSAISALAYVEGQATQSHAAGCPIMRAITPPTLKTQRDALALLLLLNRRKL